MKRRIAVFLTAVLFLSGTAFALKGFKKMKTAVLDGYGRTVSEWCAEDRTRAELAEMFAADFALEVSTEETDFVFDPDGTYAVGASAEMLFVILPGEAKIVLGVYEPLTDEASYSLYDPSLAETLATSVADSCADGFWIIAPELLEDMGTIVKEVLDDLG